jgi:NAD(P)-dependent dehydrogenase (short-subunit alcohol dehydrogenase family)
MSRLSSLRQGYSAAVFGASGGVGGAIANLLRADPYCMTIHAGARSALENTTKTTPFMFDLLDEESIAAAARSISERQPEIDLVVVATGVLHGLNLRPEKTMRVLDSHALTKSYAINAIGPALIAKHMLPFLPRDHKSVFAALSARVGSIEDNRIGGWHAYRSSKAALNQIIRTCAIELAVKNKHAICVTLHPGTVDTALSKPFQSGVSPDRLFSADTSAAHLLTVIDGLDATHSGRFFAWDGGPIPF